MLKLHKNASEQVIFSVMCSDKKLLFLLFKEWIVLIFSKKLLRVTFKVTIFKNKYSKIILYLLDFMKTVEYDKLVFNSY